jgi:hypothetical protein
MRTGSSRRLPSPETNDDTGRLLPAKGISVKMSKASQAELAICRDAIEQCYDAVGSMDCMTDTDGAVQRVTLRCLNEAIGKATPRLLKERPEGQKLYGLHWKELIAERDTLRAELADMTIQRNNIEVRRAESHNAAVALMNDIADALRANAALTMRADKAEARLNGPCDGDFKELRQCWAARDRIEPDLVLVRRSDIGSLLVNRDFYKYTLQAQLREFGAGETIRADKAEAELAELRGQEPVSYRYHHDKPAEPLFARPIPADPAPTASKPALTDEQLRMMAFEQFKLTDPIGVFSPCDIAPWVISAMRAAIEAISGSALATSPPLAQKLEDVARHQWMIKRNMAVGQILTDDSRRRIDAAIAMDGDQQAVASAKTKVFCEACWGSGNGGECAACSGAGYTEREIAKPTAADLDAACERGMRAYQSSPHDVGIVAEVRAICAAALNVESK